MPVSGAGLLAGVINLPPDVSAAHSTRMLTTPEAVEAGTGVSGDFGACSPNLIN